MPENQRTDGHRTTLTSKDTITMPEHLRPPLTAATYKSASVAKIIEKMSATPTFHARKAAAAQLRYSRFIHLVIYDEICCVYPAVKHMLLRYNRHGCMPLFSAAQL